MLILNNAIDIVLLFPCFNLVEDSQNVTGVSPHGRESLNAVKNYRRAEQTARQFSDLGQETAHRASDAANDVSTAVKNAATEVTDAAKEAARPLSPKVKEGVERTKEHARHLVDFTKDIGQRVSGA